MKNKMKKPTGREKKILDWGWSSDAMAYRRGWNEAMKFMLGAINFKLPTRLKAPQKKTKKSKAIKSNGIKK